MREEGSIELVLVLIFVLVLHIGLWLFSRSISEGMNQAYDQLDRDQSAEALDWKDFSAWGKEWLSPPPRLDFGAYNQHNKDAEALCYIVSRYGCDADGISFRCN